MNIPNMLCYLRIGIGMALPILAYWGNESVVIVGYIIAVCTDAIDGTIARSSNTVTQFGKKIDIIADNVLMVGALVSLMLVRYNVLNRLFGSIGVVLCLYMIMQSIHFFKKQKLLFLRTPIARMCSIVFPISLIGIWLNQTFLFTGYLLLMIVSLTDKMIKKKIVHPVTVTGLVIAAIIAIIFLTPHPDQLCFEQSCITAEVVDTYDARMQGLMYRESLDEDKGMLFVWEQNEPRTFWMKNTLIPLDMIFVNDDLIIVDIIENAIPCTTEPCARYPSKYPATYVIEVNAGYVQENGITVGQTIKLPII